MRASHYAHALHALLTEHPKKEDELVEGMLQSVKKNGHEHLLSKIVRSFEKLQKRGEKKSTIEVITAKEISSEEVQKILKKEPYSALLTSKHKKVDRKVDESIIGGIVIRTGGMRIDQSYKRALIELYQHITK